ncbi:MAG: hypothetical protein ACRD0D_12070 [Acidimicrobiales bacterium]
MTGAPGPPADIPGMTLLVGPSPRLPVRLLLSAIERAEANGVGVAEAHLLSATLESPRLRRVLEDHGVPVDVLRGTLQDELARPTPPAFRIDRGPGRLEVANYGMVHAVEGRAAVLAATPSAHPMDGIDIFVAAIFDFASITTRALVSECRVDRTELLRHLSGSLDRYAGVTFPSVRSAALLAPVRAPWGVRDEVVALLREAVPAETHWTYTRWGDELVIFSESEPVYALLRARGLAG